MATVAAVEEKLHRVAKTNIVKVITALIFRSASCVQFGTKCVGMLYSTKGTEALRVSGYSRK